MAVRLIVSDLDGTLIGDDAALVKFKQWLEARRESIGLVYASGRFFHSVVDAITSTEHEPLPAPDAVIAGVGTEVRTYPAGDPFPGWFEMIDVDWDVAKAREIALELDNIELQPDEFQSPYKTSFYLYEAPPDVIADLERQLVAAGLAAQVVYSSARDLDILPARANKGAAARFVAEKWGIPDHEVVVCGDTGNDLALFMQGFRGIIVGNAKPELKAFRGDNVYRAEGEIAAGVLEGLEYFSGGA